MLLAPGAAACPGSKVELFAAIRRDSVPVRLIGGQVRVLLHANDLVIFDGHQQVARRDRLTGRLRSPPRTRPLPRGTDPQAGRVARRHSTRTSPRRGGDSCQQPPERTHLALLRGTAEPLLLGRRPRFGMDFPPGWPCDDDCAFGFAPAFGTAQLDTVRSHTRVFCTGSELEQGRNRRRRPGRRFVPCLRTLRDRAG